MKALERAAERLKMPQLAEHPRTLLCELLARSECDTPRCMALMCACEDENILRMCELWGQLEDEEKEFIVIDDLAHALDIKVADIIPTISKEIVRLGKFESDMIVGLNASNVVSRVLDRALQGGRGGFANSKMFLEIANIVPVPKAKVQVHVGNVDAHQELNQAVIPSLEEVTRALEEKRAIPGREAPMLEGEVASRDDHRG